MIPPKSPMSLLSSYKPKNTEELAEWLMMAARNLKDEEGKRIYFRLEGHLAWQIASMMQEAKLEVPK
tara:strand:+ start:6199 stop:6399 length:201 start_codon:yes stop_codon:yes gene_type:complete